MKKKLIQHSALLSFFHTLYIKKPKLFYFLLSLSLLQLGVTAIKLEVTPFFLYGMFSEKTPYTGKFSDQVIYVDNKELRKLSITKSEAYLLALNMDNYLSIKKNKGVDMVQSTVETKYPFFTRSFIYPYVKDKIYNSPARIASFEAWFKHKCSDITHTTVQQVTVVQRTYLFDERQVSFKLLSSETVARF